MRQRPSAAKAVDENKPVIAALKRCSTQDLVQHGVLQQPVKSCPSQDPVELQFFGSL
jgi:hypothetical protein